MTFLSDPLADPLTALQDALDSHDVDALRAAARTMVLALLSQEPEQRRQLAQRMLVDVTPRSATGVALSPLPPDAYVIEGITNTFCGLATPIDDPLVERVIGIELLGGPVLMHSGEPSHRLTIVGTEITARLLARVLRSHDDCPDLGDGRGPTT